MTNNEKSHRATAAVSALRLNTSTIDAILDIRELVHRETRDLILNAVALQGAGALHSTLTATRYHEAGHAVVYSHFGHQVLRCKIWQRKRGIERGQWVGETSVYGKWKSDATSSPHDDLRQACCVAAGVLAEIAFDGRDFRLASSIDEIVLAKALAHNIALKTRRDPVDVMRGILSVTNDILSNNAGVVHEIASELERHGTIRKARLASILGRLSKEKQSNYGISEVATQIAVAVRSSNASLPNNERRFRAEDN